MISCQLSPISGTREVTSHESSSALHVEPGHQEVESPPFRIDHPFDQIAWSLKRAGKIDSKGIVITFKSLPLLKNRDMLDKLLSTVFHLKIKHPTKIEEVEKSLAEILKKIGNHNYLVGSYVYTLLGTDWAVEYLKEYVEVDPKLIGHFGKKRTDHDFRAVIDLKDDSRLKAEEVITSVAELSQEKEKKETVKDSVRKKDGTFSKFHPFNGRGSFKEDAFQISHEEGDFSYDINISRIPPGEVLSRQDIRINIQPLLDNQHFPLIPEGNQNNGEQAILDTILLQYHFERITPQAWARSIVYNTESSRHLSSIPEELYLRVKEFCLVYENIGTGLETLFREYIKKHFKRNPNAMVALFFNAAVALYRKDFHSEDIKDFLILIKTLCSTNECQSFYKNIIDCASSERFGLVQSFMELNILFELATQPAADRSPNHDSNYIVTHDGSDYVTSRRGGYSILVPFHPVSTIENLWNACQTDEKPIVIKIMKMVFKTSFLKVSKESILLANFSPDDLHVEEIYKYAKKFLGTKESDLRYLGYKLLLLYHSIKSNEHLINEIFAELTTIIQYISRSDLKNILEYFKQQLVLPQYHEQLDSIRVQMDPLDAYVKFLSLHYPCISLSVVKDHPEIIKNHLQYIQEVLNNAQRLSLTLSTNDFQILAQCAQLYIQNGDQKEMNRQELYALVESQMKDNRFRTATLLLMAFTQNHLFYLNSQTPKLWLKVIITIHPSNPQEAENLILLAYKEEVWKSSNNTIEVLPCLLEMIEKLLIKKHQQATEAADDFIDFLHRGAASIQSPKWDSILQGKLKRDHEKRESHSDLEHRLKALKGLDSSDRIEEARQLFRKALKENIALAKEMLLDPLIRSYFDDNPDELLEMILFSLDHFFKSKKKANDLLAAFLAMPLNFHLISLETKPEIVQKYISFVARFLLNNAGAIDQRNLITDLESAFEILICSLRPSERPEIAFEFLKGLSSVKYLPKVMSGSLYQKTIFYLLIWAVNKNNCDESEVLVQILKSIQLSFEGSEVDNHILSQLELIEISIAAKNDLLCSYLIPSLISVLGKSNFACERDCSEKFLQWAIILAKEKKYVMSAQLILALEKLQSSDLQKLVDQLSIIPEEILRLSPSIFCRALSVLNPSTSDSPPLLKIQSVVHHFLKISTSKEAGDHALNIVEKYFGNTDLATVQALEYCENLKNHFLQERAFKIYSAKLSDLTFEPEWLNDPKATIVKNWIKGWFCVMKIAHFVEMRLASHFIQRQFNDLNIETSFLYVTTEKFPEFKDKVISTIISNYLRIISSINDDSYAQIEEHICKLKSVEDCSENANHLEALLMSRFLISGNLNRFIQGCNYLIEQATNRSELNLVDLVEKAISGFLSLKKPKKGSSEFRKAMRLASKVIVEKQHSKIAGFLERHKLDEAIFFNPIRFKETSAERTSRTVDRLGHVENKIWARLCERKDQRKALNKDIIHPRDITEEDLTRMEILRYLSDALLLVPRATMGLGRKSVPKIMNFYEGISNPYKGSLYLATFFSLFFISSYILEKHYKEFLQGKRKHEFVDIFLGKLIQVSFFSFATVLTAMIAKEIENFREKKTNKERYRNS